MKESAFINQNKEKWQSFEDILDKKEKDPDKLSNLYIQVTDDLSYARTFYPNRSVRYYLNGLAQRVYHSIYKNKKATRSRIVEFWQEDLPHTVYESRRELIFSFLMFLLSFLIGWLSSTNDPDFVRSILGDNYVNMTLENIEKGDPMAVYKSHDMFEMMLMIIQNNLQVAFLTFVMGVVFAIGTVGVLLTNGIMVGAFQCFFFQHAVGMESVLTIWLHGTLEISAIVIAGGAGLVLGKGLLFPGTLSRMQAFLISARRGMKIMAGIVPIIVLAGIIESVLTRFTESPALVRGIFILISLAFVLGYFVYYPWRRSRSGFAQKDHEDRLPPQQPHVTDFSVIRNSSAAFTETFILYGKYFKPLMFAVLIISIIYTITHSIIYTEGFRPVILNFSIQNIITFMAVRLSNFFFDFSNYPLLFPLNVLAFSLLAITVHWCISREHSKWSGQDQSPGFIPFFIRHYWKMVIISALFQALFFLPVFAWMVMAVLAGPVLLVWFRQGVEERFDPWRTVNIAFGYGIETYALFLVILLLCLIFMSVMISPILFLLIDIISWNLPLEPAVIMNGLQYFLSFLYSLVFGLLLPLLFFSFGIQYYSMAEADGAQNLLKQIAQLGNDKKANGK
ncbi:MAG: stage II sporulation protein M [Bacteroidia bacterium]